MITVDNNYHGEVSKEHATEIEAKIVVASGVRTFWISAKDEQAGVTFDAAFFPSDAQAKQIHGVLDEYLKSKGLI